MEMFSYLLHAAVLSLLHDRLISKKKGTVFKILQNGVLFNNN